MDALSRRRHEVSVFSLGVDLRGRILEALPSDTWYQEVRAEIESRRTLEGRFSGYVLEFDGIVHHMGHIYVPVSGDLRTLVLSEAHCASYSAHPRVKKMHVDLKKLYFWVGMRYNVSDFVARCLECQRVKVEHQDLVGLLHPHTILEWKWDTISIDFITRLPMSSQRHNCIMVTVDKLSKVAHFSPMRASYTTSFVAHVFLVDIVRLHEIPH